MRLAVAAVALAWAAPAAAQQQQQQRRPLMPDEVPSDFDHEAETYSDFWEEAARPHAREYEAKLQAARVELDALAQDPKKFARAEALLKEAIALEPGTPDAHWRLAELYERGERWRECAAERQAVHDAVPEWRPPGRASQPWEVARGLALCRALGGELEDAIDLLRRMLAGGDAAGSHAHAYLGMALMALGRIDDAIEAFELAMTDRAVNPPSPPKEAFVKFAAAVAYDRDEQSDQAREWLDRALGADRTLSTFATAGIPFLAPGDEWYFRGLAEAAQAGRRAFAATYFRRYLAAAGEHGWRARAQEHLDALAGELLADSDIAIRGVGVIDEAAARAAVVRRAGDFQRCLADAPQLLFRVKITKLAEAAERGAGAPPAIAPPQGGVQVRQELAYEGDAPTSVVLGAQSCLEQVAARVKLPKVTGSPSSYATVELFATAH